MFRKLALLTVLILITGCAREETINPPPPPDESRPALNAALRTSYAEVVKRVSAAVVTIRVESRARAPRQFPFMDDPFFRRFFGEPLTPARDRLVKGSGSGVVVTGDGYILTNHHIVDGAQQIEVDLQGTRTVTANLVGSDPPSDVAVLKIADGGMPALALADSDKVQVGDIVLAIGNPMGIGETVTLGIISAKGRRTGLSNGSFEDFLQTDALINRGNSGGALVDGSGNLVAINSQVLLPSGASTGIGFAIPSNMARDVLDQIIKYGKVNRGHLGVVVQAVTQDIAASLRLNDANGVIISQIQPGSAAERATLRRGDVVLALNGNFVSDPNSFRNEIAGTPPGRTISLRIWREGSEQELRPSLGEFTAEERVSRSPEETSSLPTGIDDAKLGIAVQPLTPALAEQLGISADTQGLVVTEVESFGPAADAGVQPGDVIEQVNQRPVDSVTDLGAAIEHSGKKPLLLLVNHRGSTFFVTLRAR
jgi:serine protease Do